MHIVLVVIGAEVMVVKNVSGVSRSLVLALAAFFCG